jgi:hypothetical protein
LNENEGPEAFCIFQNTLFQYLYLYLIITKAYCFTRVAANEASLGRDKGTDGGEGNVDLVHQVIS